MKTFKFVLVGVLAAACGGGGGSSDRPDGRRIDGIVLPDGSGGPDGSSAGCTAQATYTTGEQPSAVFLPNFDDNGSGDGDPIANNDVMSYAAVVKAPAAAGDPFDILFVNLFEGYGTFKGKAEGSVVDFASFTLPLNIPIAGAEANAADCGACLSIWNGAVVSGGAIQSIQAELGATTGSINITSLPSAVDQTFTATLTGVGFEELGEDGAPVAGGCSSTIATLDVTAVAAADGKPRGIEVRFYPVMNNSKHGRF